MTARTTRTRRFQTQLVPVAGFIPAVGMSYLLLYEPPIAPQTAIPATVIPTLGAAAILATLAATAVLWWAPHRWLPVRLGLTVVLAALIGADTLLAATSTPDLIAAQMTVTYQGFGLAVILAGILSTIAHQPTPAPPPTIDAPTQTHR